MASSFLPYGRQTVTAADIAAVEDVLRSPWLTQGPVIPAFEEALADAMDVPYAVAVNSATSGLHLACAALGLGVGDWLWTSPITFVASANCARYCGANVDFVDIDPATGLMSLQALRLKLDRAKSLGVLPKVIVPVHLTGTSCPMEEIAALVEPYGIAILEDASHAVGASYNQQPVGNCRYSAAAVFSFHPVKIITTGEGGAVVTRDSALASRMARLRSHGITKDPAEFELEPAGPWSYEQQELGFNYRLTDIQAALGLSQLQRLEAIVEERNHLHQYYETLLEPLPIKLLQIRCMCFITASRRNSPYWS